jgi:RNA-binding protein YhbY
VRDELKKIIQQLEAKYGITGKEGFTEELVEQIEKKLQDAEMPKKKDYQEHSYYELYDEKRLKELKWDIEAIVKEIGSENE